MKRIHGISLRRRVIAFSLLAMALLLPLAASAAPGSALRLENTRVPGSVRAELDDLLQLSESLGKALNDDSNLLLGVADARLRLESVSTAELEELNESLGPQLAKLNSALRAMHDILEETAAPTATQPFGLPVAPYPNATWSYYFNAFDADANAPEPTDSSGQGRNGVCGVATRKSANHMFALLTNALTTEAIHMSLGRLCDQTVVIVGGGNTSAACIVSDIAFLIVRGINDFTTVCEDLITAAEVKGSYDRLGYIDGQLSSHDSSLKSRVGTHDTQVKGQLQNHDSAIKTKIDDQRDSITTTVEDARTALLTALSDDREFFVRIQIEEALLERKRLVMFYMPAAHGGHLELVRSITSESIDRVQAAGEKINGARTYLNLGDMQMGQGKYRAAFNHYSKAYFEAAKSLGESQ